MLINSHIERASLSQQDLAPAPDVDARCRTVHATAGQVEPRSIARMAVIGSNLIHRGCGILHDVGEIAPDFGRTICLGAAFRNMQCRMEAGRELGIINLLRL